MKRLILAVFLMALTACANPALERDGGIGGTGSTTEIEPL